MLKECWKKLPPGYRQIVTGRSQPGDLRWLSDVKQWHEVTNAEIGKLPDDIGYIFATPGKAKGAPPGYRRTNPKDVLRPGMLVWKGAEWNAQTAIDYAGKPFAPASNIIEPKPPAGWEWLHKGDELNKDTDRMSNPKGGTQWVKLPGIADKEYAYMREVSEMANHNPQGPPAKPQAQPQSAKQAAWGTW